MVQKILLRSLQLLLAAALLLCTTAATFATEPPSASPDTAGSCEELCAWLQEHRLDGGHLTLTADITMDGIFYYSRASSGRPSQSSPGELVVDCGPHRILIEGSVDFELCLNMFFTGEGGEDGLLRVAEGGSLGISGASVNASSGISVYQEEGALLFCDPELPGVHFAEQPVYYEISSPPVVVEGEEELAPLLPTKARTLCNYRGVSSRPDAVAVEWDLDAYTDEIEQRARFTLTGTLPGVRAIGSPSVLVVYRDRDVIFTDVSYEDHGRYTLICADYLLPGRPLQLELIYSWDEENWQVSSVWNTKAERLDGQFLLFLYPEEYADLAYEGDIICPDDSPPIYLCLRWMQDDQTQHSDVLCFDGTNMKHAADIGGNRGGGTDISPPSPKPTPRPPADVDSDRSTPSDARLEISVKSAQDSFAAPEEESAAIGPAPSEEAPVFPAPVPNSASSEAGQGTVAADDTPDVSGSSLPVVAAVSQAPSPSPADQQLRTIVILAAAAALAVILTVFAYLRHRRRQGVQTDDIPDG